MKTRLVLAIGLAFDACLMGLMVAAADPPAPLPQVIQVQVKPPVQHKHGRGHITPKNIAELHAKSWAAHGRRLKNLPKVTTPTWDCRTLGFVTPVDDQGQCGSCWDVSATGVLATAFCKAGYAKADGSFNISPQYILDNCGPSNGGCDGDDASTVTQWALSNGLPTTQDYGPYTAQSGRCQLKANTKMWKINAQGYCSQTQGIAATQDIKNAIVAYGPISSAVDAGGFDNYSSGVMQGDGSNIDHDVSIAGWDDTMAGGCWLVKNQWGNSWGMSGYCYIPYGKWSIGTSALWVSVDPLPPVPPIPPVPPVPPGPPSPGTGTYTLATNTDGSMTFTPVTATTLTLTTAQVQALQTIQGIVIPPTRLTAQPAPIEPPLSPVVTVPDKMPKGPDSANARLDALEKSNAELQAGMNRLIGIVEKQLLPTPKAK